MRFWKYIVFLVLTFIILPISVWAATGKITVTSASQVVEKNKVTVTVTLSSSVGIGSWEMALKYDKAYLQLTSSTAEAGGTGMVGASSSDSGIKKQTYTFVFRTLKKGSTTVSVTGYEAYAASDMSEMNLTATSKTIKIITQEELEASYSKDNNLASLAVEGSSLTPDFSKDILEYSTIVSEDTKEITITAKASDSKSSVVGDGKHEVTSGTNTFEIIVKAENGSEKTYRVIVEVKDANPINVSLGDNNYTVVKLKENMPGAPSYQETTINIEGFDVPAYTSEFTHLTLVGLKDSLGNINLYIYDNGKYTIYKEIGFNKVTIYPLNTNESLDGYTKQDVVINDIKVTGYKYNNNSRFIIIYGINIDTGEKDFYLYDTKNQSLTIYNNEYINELVKQNQMYTYIIFGFIGILILLIITIIILIRKKKVKKDKPNKKV